MNDVVTYNVRAGGNGHSATFPRDLIGPRIVSSCPRGGVVLDPFCGSGTTISVALDLHRRGIGFDLFEDYLIAASRDLAQGRLLI
jgi:site-specific DNA-methyltransferase (adenine-specific)